MVYSSQFDRRLNRLPIGEFVKAAHLSPKVLGQDAKRWEDWVFLFAQKQQLEACDQFPLRIFITHLLVVRSLFLMFLSSHLN